MSFIDDTIYQLKREYGFSLILIHIISKDFNIDTGQERLTVNQKYIKKAVLLPNTIVRAILPSKAVYNFDDRFILLDNKDFDTVAIDDKIIFNSKEYSVNNITEYYQESTILKVSESKGSPVSSSFSSDLDLEDEYTKS